MKRAIHFFLAGMVCLACLFLPSSAETSKEEFFTVARYDRETGETTYISYPKAAERAGSDGAEQTRPAFIPGEIEVETRDSTKNSILVGTGDLIGFSQTQNVYAFPHSGVILLDVGLVDDLSVYTATGYMVGPDVMLTAAHVFLGSKGSNPAEYVRPHKFQNADQLDATQYEPWSIYYYSPAYAANYDENEDWAIVILENNVAAYTGYLGLGTAGSISNKSIGMSGYPLSRKYKQTVATGGKMNSSGNRRFTHEYLTYDGHSGSPAYDNTYVAWGIHTRGYSSLYYPSGVRYNQSLYNLICGYIDAGRLKYGY